MEPVAILFGAGFTAASAWGLGRWLLARLGAVPARDEAPAIQFVAGAAALSCLVFALAAARLAYPAVFLAAGSLAIAAGVRTPSGEKTGPAAGRWWHALPFAPFFVWYLVFAMAPETSPDGSAYHLGLTAQYLRAHALVPVPTNMYASLSQGMEMLFLFAFAFGKHSSAAVLHVVFLAALAWQMWRYGVRVGFPVAGWCAALLVAAAPVVGMDTSIAYNDVALAATVFTLFRVLEYWDAERRPGLLPVAGLLAGFAYALKYTGGTAVPYALGFVLWRARAWRPAAVVGLCAAVPILPWLAKNWLWIGNPVAPFFNDIFPNPYVTPAFEKGYREMLSMYELKSRWQIPVELTLRGGISGLLGPVFLLSPLAFAALARREGRRLLAACAVFGATYFSNVGARFLIPVLPFLSLAMMLALGHFPRIAVAAALLHAVLSWPTVIPRYARPDVWRISKFPWREALRLRPIDRYMEDNLMHWSAIGLIERVTPPDATIFSFTPIAEAYTSRRILVAYQSAPNNVSGTILWTPAVPGFAPGWRLRFSFPRRALEAVRVVQTASGKRDQWHIHELHILDGSRELDRSQRWRISARPTPWTIGDAFDGGLLTFWMAGERVRPGQYVQVEFGRPEAADAVLIESSPDQAGIRLRLEGRSPGGSWNEIAAAPEVSNAAPPLRMRRAAAEELKRRGIDYVLVLNTEVVADDLRSNTEQWGVRLAGEAGQMRLYELPRVVGSGAPAAR